MGHKKSKPQQNHRPSHGRLMSQKSGQPPGSLLHVGTAKTEKVTIRVTHYDNTQVSESQIDVEALCAMSFENEGVFWIQVEGLNEIHILDRLSHCFHLHPLVMEDVLNTAQRPKIEIHENYTYMVTKHLSYDSATHQLDPEQITLILGRNFVMSFGEQPIHLFEPILKRLQDNFGQIRNMGADFLLYNLLDAIIDQYFVVIDDLEEAAETLEYEMLNNPTQQTLHAIHQLKRQMLHLHKAIWPFREVVAALSRGDTLLISTPTLPYVRDLYDHTVQIMDTTETLRDILTSMVDLYLTTTSNRMNEIMKVLTIMSTVFIPLTFIAGLYGMNLPGMPEYKWPYSYPVILALMLVIVVVMLTFFKRKKWW